MVSRFHLDVVEEYFNFTASGACRTLSALALGDHELLVGDLAVGMRHARGCQECFQSGILRTCSGMQMLL